MKTTKIILTPFVLMLAVLALTSCDKDIGATGDRVDKATYSLTVTSDTGIVKKLVGNDVDSNWDDDLGLIWLGTDKENLPTGTLTINLNVHTSNNTTHYSASSILLSTSDVLVGTAAEINAKLFVMSSSLTDLEDVVIGSNYISGKLVNIEMTDSNTGESVTLNGEFVAKSK